MSTHHFSPILSSALHLAAPNPPIRKLLTSRPQFPVIRALRREWREYEDAVKEKDLDRALRFLKSMETVPSSSSLSSLDSLNSPVSYPPDQRRPERDWEVLDTCLNADDMRLVGSAYAFLQDQGLLQSFGKYKNIVLEGPRLVTPTVLKESTGLEAAKLAPKKWGLSGSSRNVLIAFLGGVSFLVSQGVDIRPNLAAVLALAYLMGCPIRGVILDPFVALQMGIKGQAGTQFWDEKLENELAEGRLSGTAFDRYSMVLFSGIAAEALVYGEAEGGENDENLFRSICALLEPPLEIAEMANRARWSVLQSYNLLKWHKRAHRAAVDALESGHSLSIVIKRIEETMVSSS